MSSSLGSRRLALARSFRTMEGSLLALLILIGCSQATPTPGQSPSPGVQPTSSGTGQTTTTVRVGYQKGAGVLTLLKARGDLEKRLGPSVTVSWTLFPAGPPLLEAMNSGTIDVGTTGETPPIFAQAAGTPLVYVATTLSNGAGQAIIVPAASPIKKVADLKGKKVAFTKASSAHLMLVRALEANGLHYGDVEPVFLAPADARAAFQGGSVDAWVIWDPFLSAAEQELKARPILNGQDLGPTRGYYLASRSFVQDHPDLMRAIVDELQKAATWTKQHRDEYAQLLSQETGVDLAVWRQALQTDTPDVTYVDDATITAQQQVADIFFRLGLIPKRLDVRQASWSGGS